MKRANEYGISIPYILLPKNIDVATWSVIACDQYTQDESYWQKAAERANAKPSTLHLILPEVYLSKSDKNARIEKINETMKEYLASGVFAQAERECVYVERTISSSGKVRKGLVVAIDLEAYDWKEGTKAKIRATEATIKERIPPRKAIRENAELETPHIMLLVNDKSRALVEKTGEAAKAESGAKLYDGDLMLSGGHITGYAVKSEKAMNALFDGLEEVKRENTAKDGDVFMFAVGDGNHSLATAKAVWDDYKAKTGESDGEKRYALVEIVNIYDEALEFKPIHRALFNVDAEECIKYLVSALNGRLEEVESEDSFKEYIYSSKECEHSESEGAVFCFAYNDSAQKMRYFVLKTAINDLAVSHLQPVLDAFIKEKNEKCAESGKVEIDYIHGEEELLKLSHTNRTLCIFLPPIEKENFFDTINKRGSLPRKSFSMGEADEKRFYLECRCLR